MKLQIPTARVFAPLLAPSRYKAAHGGRGSGKSRFFAGLAIETSYLKPGSRGVCIREVQKDLKESAKLLIEDRLAEFGCSTEFYPLKSEIRTPGGGLIIFRGMNDYTADSIKSLEDFDWAWIEEAQTLSARSLELLRPTMRKAGSELWFGWNPRNPSDPVDQFFRGLAPPANATIVRANYSDNPWFPKELEDERQLDEQNNRDRYGHIWLGDYEPMVVGALWDRATLHTCRLAEAPPDLERIVVAVDPPISSEPGADEAGIVAAGRQGQKAYVLEDASLRGTPRQWAERAVQTFDKWDADAFVVERNQGGDMVKHTLHTVRPGAPIIEVVATRGKHVRAEPIAALYPAGRVHHCGTFDKMEDQMCLVGGSLIETDHGFVPIEEITTQHRVLTRNGFAPLRWAGYTGHASEFIEIGTDKCRIRATASHPIFDTATGEFVSAAHVTSSQSLLVSRNWENMVDRLRGEVVGITGCQVVTTGTRKESFSIARFTKHITAEFQMAMTFITSMATQAITVLETLRQLVARNIRLAMMPKASLSGVSVPSLGPAWYAGERQALSTGSLENTAQTHATCARGARNGRRHRSFRLRASGAAPLERQSASENSVLTNARTITTLGRTTLENGQPVYNLSVAEGYLPEFFANGILVHNCQTTASGYEGPGSPDRMDAAIWGLTELLPPLIRKSHSNIDWNAPVKGGGWLGT